MTLTLRTSARIVAALTFTLVVASCSESVTTSSSAPASTLAPQGPNKTALPFGCIDAGCTGIPGDPVSAITAHVERLQICKIYSSGSGPDVTVNLDVTSPDSPNSETTDGKYHLTYQLPANTCKLIWSNGEIIGVKPDGSFSLRTADQVTVTEVVPAGYTTSTTATTIQATDAPIRAHQTYASSSTTVAGTTASGPIGGFQVPGLTVVFTNTAIPVIQTGSIGDFAWIDANGNGRQDPGEPGLAGVTLTLSGATTGSQVTDGSGAYSFNALAIGSYAITATPPSGWVPTLVGAAGTTAANDNNASPSAVTLSSGNLNNTTTDFGFVPVAGGGQGCTPGYWKQTQHFDSWMWYAQTDMVDNVFGVTYRSTLKNNPHGPLSLLDALELNGNTNSEALFRIGTAALLNSVYHSGVSYPYTAPEVIAMVHNAWTSGNPVTWNATKDLLDKMNNAGCPLN